MSAADAVRYVGTLVELTGLGLVAWVIRETAHRFDRRVTEGLRTMVDRAAAWRPFRRKPEVVQKVAGDTATVKDEAWVTVRGEAAHPTLEARIDALEDRVRQGEERSDSLDARLRRESEERQAADDRERRAREQTDENVRRLVRQQAAGGLGKEALGVACFAFGLLLTNLSEEIARWLP